MLEGNRGKVLGMLPSSELTLGHWGEGAHMRAHMGTCFMHREQRVCVCVCVHCV